MYHPSAALGSERFEMLHPIAVALCRAIFVTHNPAAVAEPEHAVHEMDTTAVCATHSPPFTGKCGDDKPAAWYQGIVLQHTEHLLPCWHSCDFVVYQSLSYRVAYNLFLVDYIPEK
jgi:hypothetical protein